MAKNNKIKQGFTIIEVVLVLAIAGLIFLMVFVAFPALQRSQQDTQRQNDLSRLSTQITNFKTNNNGKIPGKSSINDGQKVTITGYLNQKTEEPTRGTWAYFYDRYMLAEGDTFKDPDGTAYSLKVVVCTPASGSKTCGDQAASDFVAQNHQILVSLKARCEGENIVQATGNNNIAIAYKKQGGGILCINN